MKQGKRYPDEFREAAVELLLNSRRSQKDLAADINVTARTLRRWRAERERLGPQWTTKQREHKKVLAAKNKEIVQLRSELALMGAMNRFLSSETR